MIKYQVWSTLVGPRPERDSKEPPVPAVDQHETTRTDHKVAEEDYSILTSILHRKAWITEVKS